MPQGSYLPEGSLLNTEQNRASFSSSCAIEKAFVSGKILEARATVCDAAHNLIVDLGGIQGVIPRSEAASGIESGATREIAIISRVGKPVCFKIADIEGLSGPQPRVILSRRAAQEEAAAFLIENLSCGEVIKAKVTHLEPFGAFVDIGCGVVSLIGIENISVSRISHPRDRFVPGQDIFAAVLSVDKVLRRVALTHRELLGTWEENVSRFCPNETVEGVIRGIEDYGVFVELCPNLSGLAEKRPGIGEGKKVSVYIKSIIPERMKIKLVIIDVIEALPEPNKPEYFITSGRLSYWRYTPEQCDKKPVETYF